MPPRQAAADPEWAVLPHVAETATEVGRICNIRLPVFTIDRFEGPAWAVLEDELARARTVPRSWVPPGAREGDVLSAPDDLPTDPMQVPRLDLDPTATADRRRLMQERRDRLPRGPSGNIRL